MDKSNWCEPSVIFTEKQLEDWRTDMSPLPFPEYMVPTSGDIFEGVDDDVLLNAPPHLLVHAMRTAAQGGLQVISPRQVPFSTLMTRHGGECRLIGDHVVGSVADPVGTWPTIDGRSFDDLLPDEPLPRRGMENVAREKTRTDPLTRSHRMLSDPVLACLVKGRAVIDILRRDDVNGGADQLTELLADAWGLTVSELNELDAYTLGVDGDLLRHAIKADEVFPTFYAPIHVKKSISVGSTMVTREYLPEHTAIDWRRMRVFCEAVYSLCASIEGIPIAIARAVPPPGDPIAPPNRKNVLCFMPAPTTAWSFAPSSFSIYPKVEHTSNTKRGVPREVLEAMSKYGDIIHPVTQIMAGDRRARYKHSTTKAGRPVLGETLRDTYAKLSTHIIQANARGKTAAATVRSAIYDTIDNAPRPIKMRLARYIQLAKSESLTHLGLTEVPMTVVDKIAQKFVEIGDLFRMQIAAEASRRGSTLSEWWSNILSQAPKELQELTEGSAGWARVGMWTMFKAPTDRWDKLRSAINYEALRDYEKKGVTSISLPAEVGSISRIMGACRHVCHSITKMYAGYYSGVTDVGLAIADELESRGDIRSAQTLREGSYLWMLRARAFRGANVVTATEKQSKGARSKSVNHMLIRGRRMDLFLAPTPYRAFVSYQSHVKKSSILGKDVKRHMACEWEPPLSNVFLSLNRPILPARESTVTRYLTQPSRLGRDWEKSWSELTSDLKEILLTFEMEGEAKKSKKQTLEAEFETIEIPTLEQSSGEDYYTALCSLDQDVVDWVEGVLEMMDPHEVDALMDHHYVDGNDLVRAVRGWSNIYVMPANMEAESVT